MPVRWSSLVRNATTGDVQVMARTCKLWGVIFHRPSPVRKGSAQFRPLLSSYRTSFGPPTSKIIMNSTCVAPTCALAFFTHTIPRGTATAPGQSPHGSAHGY